MSDPDLDARLMDALLRAGDSTPLHNRVEDGLRQLIRSGQVSAGTCLPGEVGLAATLGLSRHTVRHALGTLVNEGLLRRRRGRGTQVLSSSMGVHERRLERLYAFAWETQSWHVEHHSIVLEFGSTLAGSAVARRLIVAPEAVVKRIVRVRIGNDEPLIYEISHVPAELANGLDAQTLERASIYDEIERLHGLRITRAEETIRPTLVPRPVARLLGVRTNAPAFRVERTTWAGDAPIEAQESIVRGDRFVYAVSLDRDAAG